MCVVGCPSNYYSMERESDGILCKCSVLLELAAFDDLPSFKYEVEQNGFAADQTGLWYARTFGSNKMQFQERTPLMIAAMFGSVRVMMYLIRQAMVDVNRACGSDKATALHCAVFGASALSVEAVSILLDASCDTNCLDANGNVPSDLIAPTYRLVHSSTRRAIEEMLLLNGRTNCNHHGQEKLTTMPQLLKEGSEKKEYPIDVSLPDINNGLYATDEFRMYSFKVKPCSRAYSHDWTECPFVHPGENARRRDPKKYPYSCVPCPDFRKASCQKNDACEYAHGVFESWLHPAQYRTRLCKDETGCNRKVCFFAHKPEDLRPVYASTGSAIPSPKSVSGISEDMPPSPLSLPTSPNRQNKINLTPPALLLPGSRLKSSLNARDLNFEIELLALENQNTLLQQQRRLMDEISTLSSPSSWSSNNLDDAYGISVKTSRPSTPTHIQSPTGHQMRQNINQIRNLSSSPTWKQSSHGYDSSAAVAAAVMNSRSSAFANRSQSFIDRGQVPNRLGLTAAANSASMMPSNISDWSSRDGKLDWGIQGDEISKLRKSASFGFRTNKVLNTAAADFTPSHIQEPDVSWVNTLVKDVGPERRHFSDTLLPPWMEQLYIEQEQMVAA